MVSRKDLGDHLFDYAYDAGGRLVRMAGNGETSAWYYLNTGLVSGMSVGIGEFTQTDHDVLYSTYGYDAPGLPFG